MCAEHDSQSLIVIDGINVLEHAIDDIKHAILLFTGF